ncbi:hypothetical protein OE749_13370 [Aestuariibacter sp. AA17]|uniref:MvdD-like pre-ATP grasp domain-containing protein n=1 Tax=Fluctibacter corallii TaxID=2984329 RepID=A0ABT3ABP2_9ALTE|nr:hypothetical protein [Aestuariibacter sp. AA17]MCV2885682.1 hypothetical protein [Aestuariibacter sp. AA17]
MKKILILSNQHDYHVMRMLDVLRARRIPYFTLNFDEFPSNYALSQYISGSESYFSLKHLRSNECIHSEEIGAVWSRKPAPFSFGDKIEDDFIPFANAESEHALFSALYTLPCYWMNHPKQLRAAMWKGEQLVTAHRLGLNIPNTLISNDPESVTAFHQRSESSIYKTMSDPIIMDTGDDYQAVFTSLVKNDMLEDEASLALIPNQFQHYVDKAYELRVTYIDGTLYSAKIDSQKHPESRVDCRQHYIDIPYSHYSLPDLITEKCIKFIQHYGLNYAALDFIVTPEGSYVFLENNPNGQFLFVEERVSSLPLTSIMADALIKACKL